MKSKMLILAVMLLVAACGGDDDADIAETTSAPATTTQAPATTQAPETTPAPSGATVALASSSLGDVLVDGDGMTLYLFVPDAQGPSTCYDGCATAWPPLVGDAVAGDGIDEALLGSVARDDGTQQATYNGWPLYYFASDAAPGDVTGQGANDVWFVLSATGDAIAG